MLTIKLIVPLLAILIELGGLTAAILLLVRRAGAGAWFALAGFGLLLTGTFSRAIGAMPSIHRFIGSVRGGHLNGVVNIMLTGVSGAGLFLLVVSVVLLGLRRRSLPAS